MIGFQPLTSQTTTTLPTYTQQHSPRDWIKCRSNLTPSLRTTSSAVLLAPSQPARLVDPQPFICTLFLSHLRPRRRPAPPWSPKPPPHPLLRLLERSRFRRVLNVYHLEGSVPGSRRPRNVGRWSHLASPVNIQTKK